MRKLLAQLALTAILGIGLSSLANAQTTISPTYTYDPVYYSTAPADSTQPSSSTTATPAEGTYDPAVLQGPSSGGEPFTGTATTDPNGTTTTDPNQPTATTDPAPTSIVGIPTTTTPTRPPYRPTPTPTPTEPLPEPTEQCPPLDPLANQPVECPKTEVVPIIPQAPYVLGGTALAGMILFWLIFSTLNRQQSRSEARLNARQLVQSHQQTVSSSRQRAYNELLDFLTTTIASNQTFNQTEYQHLSSQIEILGSPQMQDINQKIKTVLENGKSSHLKPLLRELADQIKLES